MTETAIPVFETGSFSRSDTSPGCGVGENPAQRQNGYDSEAKPPCQSTPRGVWDGGFWTRLGAFLAMTAAQDTFKPGDRVVVTQQIPREGASLSAAAVTGEVVRFEQSKTGSWYAHAKDDKLWLDRLVLKKDDGEIVVFNLDNFTRIETA